MSKDSIKERGSRYDVFDGSAQGSEDSSTSPDFGSLWFNPSQLASPNSHGHGLQVQIYHIPTQQTVEFAAFLTDFSDSFASNWDSQEVFGRMDPVMNFKNTTRTVTLAWDVPSAYLEEAKRNMAEVNKLIQFLYPEYNKHGDARTMAGSPLVKIQFQNLLASGRNSKGTGVHLDVNAKTNGLISAITSCTAIPDLDVGFFTENNGKSINNFGNASSNLSAQWPKLWKVNISFTVLHDHEMGGKFVKAKGFPYMTDSQDATRGRNVPDEDETIPPSVEPEGEEPGAPKDKGGSAGVFAQQAAVESAKMLNGDVDDHTGGLNAAVISSQLPRPPKTPEQLRLQARINRMTKHDTGGDFSL